MDERRLDLVEQENATLRERVQQLEELLVAQFHVPFEWGLTTSEARLFNVLIARELVTKPAALAALYHNLGRDEAEEKIVDVFICKLRKKINPFGVRVLTVWGEGYRLDPVQRAHLRARLETRAAA